MSLSVVFITEMGDEMTTFFSISIRQLEEEAIILFRGEDTASPIRFWVAKHTQLGGVIRLYQVHAIKGSKKDRSCGLLCRHTRLEKIEAIHSNHLGSKSKNSTLPQTNRASVMKPFRTNHSSNHHFFPRWELLIPDWRYKWIIFSFPPKKQMAKVWLNFFHKNLCPWTPRKTRTLINSKAFSLCFAMCVKNPRYFRKKAKNICLQAMLNTER